MALFANRFGILGTFCPLAGLCYPVATGSSGTAMEANNERRLGGHRVCV